MTRGNGLPRWIEAPLATIALLIFSPLLLVVALLIKITSRGPVVYSQQRVGAGGRPFLMRKFRSMTVSSTKGLKVTASGDTRVTLVGRVLRKLKLDELPELWNVVRGDMSLVGPRPEVPDYVDWSDPLSRSVMRARPGVTDPMTLRLRNEEELLASAADADSGRDRFYRTRLRPFKLRGYREYLQSRSWLSDLSVLARSVLVVIAPSLAQTPSVPEIESTLGPAPTMRDPKQFRALLRNRRPFIILFQVGLVVLAHWAALLLRFDGAIPADERSLMWTVTAVVVGCRLVAFVPFKLFEGFWRYVGVAEIGNIVGAVLTSSAASYAVVAYGLHYTVYPRSVFMIDAIVLILFMSGARISFRVTGRWARSDAGTKRVLVFGAGTTGARVVRDMLDAPEHGYRPVGFIDDDPSKRGLRIDGVSVLGSRQDLPAIIEKTRPSEVLLAVPRASLGTIRSVVMSLAPYKVAIKTMPTMSDLLRDGRQTGQVRDLAIDDLLPRAPVGLDRQPLRRLIEGKRVMVTGAGGSIGSELCRQIASLHPASLILYERYENSLYTIANDLADRGHSSMQPVLGDVTDRRRLDDVMTQHGPDIVFHAAAHKHVPLMEANACEAVKNNVIGTRLLAEACERHAVDRFILISSDKAVNPSSVMGATKRIDELLVQLFAARQRTTFVAVRFGNVLGSSGSVVPRFLDQIRAGGPVTVTHPEMRRYFMLTSEAVHLVLHAAAHGRNGGTYVLDMGEQISVLELARNVIKLAGHVPDEEIPIQITGLRPGEKLTEDLVGADESVQPSTLQDILEVRASKALDLRQLATQIGYLETLAVNGQPAAVLEQIGCIVPTFRQSADSVERPAQSAGGTDLMPLPMACPSCGAVALHRSRCRTEQERKQKEITDERLYACERCDWRGWMIPPENRDAVSAVMNLKLDTLDLGSLDSAIADVMARPR